MALNGNNVHVEGIPGILSAEEQKKKVQEELDRENAKRAPIANKSMTAGSEDVDSLINAVGSQKEARGNGVEDGAQVAWEKGATERDRLEKEREKEIVKIAKQEAQRKQLEKDIADINAIRMSLGAKTPITALPRMKFMNLGVTGKEKRIDVQLVDVAPANNNDHLQDRYGNKEAA